MLDVIYRNSSVGAIMVFRVTPGGIAIGHVTDFRARSWEDFKVYNGMPAGSSGVTVGDLIHHHIRAVSEQSGKKGLLTVAEFDTDYPDAEQRAAAKEITITSPMHLHVFLEKHYALAPTNA